jgi:glutathione S-transferase
MEINPTGQVPVLVDKNFIITDSSAICEYLEETCSRYINSVDLCTGVESEIRALVNWFDKF